MKGARTLSKRQKEILSRSCASILHWAVLPGRTFSLSCCLPGKGREVKYPSSGRSLERRVTHRPEDMSLYLAG